MTTENKAGMTVLTASAGMVLCDGFTATSVRDEASPHTGKVCVKIGTDISGWEEMTEAAADALISANAVEYETETEAKAAAYDIIMGGANNE